MRCRRIEGREDEWVMDDGWRMMDFCSEACFID